MHDTLAVFMVHHRTFSSLQLFFTHYSDTLPTLHHTSERGRFLRLNTTNLGSRKFANAAFKTVSRLLFRLLSFVPRCPLFSRRKLPLCARIVRGSFIDFLGGQHASERIAGGKCRL